MFSRASSLQYLGLDDAVSMERFEQPVYTGSGIKFYSLWISRSISSEEANLPVQEAGLGANRAALVAELSCPRRT